ncbi:hypothetical protein MKW94_012064 [Papaver nudicaule]|uniref:HTH myb-type domain-containing protein n=1 Tax=Papaver nudicaule TaxID=74823 RepID=A0AA41VSA8_PAPNU|nr:hypothetical protein [Papaver nudicaule]
MRWTRNLHDCFVQAIDALGCDDKATPKSIHKKMGVKGLTIYHVKSHLQKYRLTRYLPDSKEDKRSLNSELTNRATTPERESEPSKKSAPNLEALCLQREIQKSLGILIEFQSQLQLRAEENARQLQKLFEKHNKDQFNDESNDASLRNNLHGGDKDMLKLEVRLSPDYQKKPRVDLGTSVY